MLRSVLATRYSTPLREGGSLPGLMEADDDGLYVVKFRGAGQGRKALVAEVVAGEIGRVLGLPVPELVLIDVDPALGRNEPDFEVRGLLVASPGINLGMDFLPGALSYTPALPVALDGALASAIVWFDAYVTNVDRTPRNPNLLVWHKQLWLIDHGSALLHQHQWEHFLARSRSPFTQIADHVLLPRADALAEADARLRKVLTPKLLTDIVALVPDDWLRDLADDREPAAARERYVEYLVARRDASDVFVEEALNARARRV